MWSRTRDVAVAVLLLCNSMAFADNDNFELNDVVVTATRTAQTIAESLAPVSILTREDIERSQAHSVEDILGVLPGISVANQGGQGKLSSLFMRGTNANQVLILLDGVRLGSATSGLSALQDLPIDLIDRIEIVRGSRSSLYGADAMGGVIQLFTRKGGDGTTKPTLAFGGGSYGSWQTAATLSGGSDNGAWYSMGLTALGTRGINACQGSLSAGCFTIEPDKDGYRKQSTRVRAGWNFDPTTSIDVNVLESFGHNFYDGSYANQSRTKQQVLAVNLSALATDNWHSNLRLGQHQDKSDDFKDQAFVSRFNSLRDSISWQNDFVLAVGHQLIVGVDWQVERVNSTTAFAVTSRNNHAIFVQYLAKILQQDLQVALRHDDNQQFGGKTTGSVAWGYTLNPKLRFTASFSTAFKVPTFNDLYYPDFSNQKLQPETSRSIDLGLAGKTGIVQWSLNVFETRIDDLIGLDAFWVPNNINQAHIYGFEATAITHIAEWDVRGHLNLLDPENQTLGDINYGHFLPRRAQASGALLADRYVRDWGFGFTIKTEGRRYDDIANMIPMGGYATFDLRVEYALNKEWRLQARVENLFDKDYQTAYLYNQPGRGIYATLRYQP